jgi:hypothetical protein
MKPVTQKQDRIIRSANPAWQDLVDIHRAIYGSYPVAISKVDLQKKLEAYADDNPPIAPSAPVAANRRPPTNRRIANQRPVPPVGGGTNSSTPSWLPLALLAAGLVGILLLLGWWRSDGEAKLAQERLAAITAAKDKDPGNDGPAVVSPTQVLTSGNGTTNIYLMPGYNNLCGCLVDGTKPVTSGTPSQVGTVPVNLPTPDAPITPAPQLAPTPQIVGPNGEKFDCGYSIPRPASESDARPYYVPVDCGAGGDIKVAMTASGPWTDVYNGTQSGNITKAGNGFWVLAPWGASTFLSGDWNDKVSDMLAHGCGLPGGCKQGDGVREHDFTGGKLTTNAHK